MTCKVLKEKKQQLSTKNPITDKFVSKKFKTKKDSLR